MPVPFILRERYIHLRCIMDLGDCVKFAKENPVTFIATAEGSQPRVRAFSMWTADLSGFYYHTATTKDVYRQMKRNPAVELCFCTPPGPGMKMMRVAGKVEFLSDPSFEERLLKDRPWVKDLMKDAPPATRIAIFRIPHGVARFWTMESNLREDEVPKIRF